MRSERTLEEGMDRAATMEECPPRRPWALIAACLVLVVLTAMLWMKWSDSRRNAARLEKELTRVYKEAEDLRLQATLAHERMVKLEREVRALQAERDRLAKPPEEKPKSVKPPPRR
jgi:septal ring factor EnvC (AmiA/AmiB activator)